MPRVPRDLFFDDEDAGPYWLAIGESAARALEAHGERFLGPDSPPITCVANVHAGLELLARRRPLGCVVSGTVLDARPHAALESLRRHVQPAPMLVHSTGAETPNVRKAALALGIHVWQSDGTGGGTATATSLPRAREAVARQPAVEPPAPEAARRPAPAATAPSSPSPPSTPLPRADDDAPVAGAADPGRFAEGCLERISRLRALMRYTVRTLSEATNASRISLMLREPERGTLCLRAGRGMRESLMDSMRTQLGTGIAGRVAALGRPITGHGSPGGARDYTGRAYVVLPLGRGRKCEGVVCLTGLPDDALPDPATLRTWTLLCRRAGAALRGARTLQRARALSTSDALTRLPNRRAFERALRRELERARRNGSHLVVGLFDVDHFKAFNDRYGHAVGDRVLREVARRLQTSFRETDLVTRWGGEEFAVLLPGLEAERQAEALRLMDRARLSVRGRPFVLGDGLTPARVTVSGGFAVFPTGGEGGDTLLRKADERLYEAKDDGRDRIKGPSST